MSGWVQQSVSAEQSSSTWSTDCSTGDNFRWSRQSSNVAFFSPPQSRRLNLSVGFSFCLFFFFSLFLSLKRNYMAPETYQLSWRRGRTLLKHWIETLKLWHSIKKVTASKSSGCSSVQLGLISFFALFFYYLCVNKYTYYIFSSKCSTWEKHWFEHKSFMKKCEFFLTWIAV